MDSNEAYLDSLLQNVNTGGAPAGGAEGRPDGTQTSGGDGPFGGPGGNDIGAFSTHTAGDMDGELEFPELAKLFKDDEEEEDEPVEQHPVNVAEEVHNMELSDLEAMLSTAQHAAGLGDTGGVDFPGSASNTVPGQTTDSSQGEEHAGLAEAGEQLGAAAKDGIGMGQPVMPPDGVLPPDAAENVPAESSSVPGNEIQGQEAAQEAPLPPFGSVAPGVLPGTDVGKGDMSEEAQEEKPKKKSWKERWKEKAEEKAKKKAEKDAKKKAKKNAGEREDGQSQDGEEDKKASESLLKKLLSFLAGDEEDIDSPDEAGDSYLPVENKAVSEEADKGKSKDGKKAKKSKKEKDKEKRKKEKLKKEIKARQNKPPKAPEKPLRPIGKKRIIVTVLFSVTILGVILLLTSYIPDFIERREGAAAYAEGNYERVYELLATKKLRGKEQSIYDAALLCLQMDRRLKSYENCKKMEGMEVEQLHALISGVDRYQKIYEQAQQCGVTEHIDSVYGTILDILQSEYGISQAEAERLVAIEDKIEYTKELMRIVGQEIPTAADDGTKDGEKASPGTDSADTEEEMPEPDSMEDFLPEPDGMEAPLAEPDDMEAPLAEPDGMEDPFAEPDGADGTLPEENL